MPSSITHDYFCKDVYNKIKIKDKIILNDFCSFGEGPDPYFFYNFHLTNKAKNVHKINKAMQHSKVNEHFIQLINYINDNNYYSNKQVLSYLYGQLCHYILDSTIHPFIIYNTGMYDEKNRNTYKYNGLHEKMEYYIDIYFIYKRENIIPRKYKVHKNILNVNKFNEQLNDLVDNVTKSVYDFDNVSKIYYKSLKDMKKFYYVFNYDPVGIKKFVYSIMDFICGNEVVKKKELSFFVNPNSNLSYLNLEHNIWKHPITGKEYTYSFFDLYDKAITKAINTINEIDKMLETKKINNAKLKILIGNLDYGSGLDCNINNKYKYYKF